jgi:hypothetical protein
MPQTSPQLVEVVPHGAKSGNRLSAISAPARSTVACCGTPFGEDSNGGQMYALSARERGGRISAVELHRLVDASKETSGTGCKLTVR